ncbi:hypothetical protein RCL1_002211 [Eukaryota sp. TZLM3-RCL]
MLRSSVSIHKIYCVIPDEMDLKANSIRNCAHDNPSLVELVSLSLDAITPQTISNLLTVHRIHKVVIVWNNIHFLTPQDNVQDEYASEVRDVKAVIDGIEENVSNGGYVDTVVYQSLIHNQRSDLKDLLPFKAKAECEVALENLCSSLKVTIRVARFGFFFDNLARRGVMFDNVPIKSPISFDTQFSGSSCSDAGKVLAIATLHPDLVKKVFTFVSDNFSFKRFCERMSLPFDPNEKVSTGHPQIDEMYRRFEIRPFTANNEVSHSVVTVPLDFDSWFEENGPLLKGRFSFLTDQVSKMGSSIGRV